MNLGSIRRFVGYSTKLFKNQISQGIHFNNKMTMQSSSQQNYIVNHDEKNLVFSIQLKEVGEPVSNEKAVLEYAYEGKDTIDMYHTGVPTSYRGKGIAKILATNAMDFAVEKNLKVIPSCTYIQKFLKDNPKDSYIKRVIKI